ncbi:MAG: hypothetical protein HETSPECPRED_003176 [Heterodermia speciosa]|uniref:mRNA decay factor PAT1 domain-containing protein n=1 Tax=Heterodermia speciosa TaxID=116794 RepID=A0A8H3IDW3_9LECA|nr:MAG: hypothetical protein HETSPECPRED_003176 [Heterodermia speciosa]
MSFFGFDPAIPRGGGHPDKAPGFGAAPDPFAGISQHQGTGYEDEDAIDFDDTYDGLGDQLDETNDDLNDATFGGIEATTSTLSKPVGKDFDFHGQTAKVSNVINEEQFRYNRQHVSRKPQNLMKQTRPFKTGYEAYENPDYIPDLQVDVSSKGQTRTASGNVQASQSSSILSAVPQAAPAAAPARKMMSLEEVETAMRAQPKKSASVLTTQGRQQSQTMTYPNIPSAHAQHPLNVQSQSSAPVNLPPQQLSYQRASQNRVPLIPQQVLQAELPGQSVPNTARPGDAPQAQQRSQMIQQSSSQESAPHRQILQNPKRQSAQLAPRPPEPPLPPPQQQPRVFTTGAMGASQQLPIITHPQQLMQLSEEDRNAFLLEDAKRAKRNHKIYMLSRNNGLMTPQDKNFITRIQLQQLMTATGNTVEQDPDAVLSEDFYYQVTSQIRGGARQNPQQPLSNFAQTYLFQTGSRHGGPGRRQNRGGDNHMQRMEMQVQRAVEAAKAKPKNKQLVIEGSLGKISFSNAKTPKPLLNIKRNDSHDRPQSAGRQATSRKVLPAKLSISGRKSILRNIEAVYSTLMKMEDHERRLPAAPANEEQMSVAHHAWQEVMESLGQKLWDDLKVMDPIVEESSILHPFIAFLSYPKGKKAIPRIFRLLDEEKRLTILTMIVVHLNILDVIQNVQPGASGFRPSLVAREEVELFSQTVMPSLFAYVNEAPLQIVIGLLGLIVSRADMQVVLRTKVGLNILTMLLSRAELVKQSQNPSDQEWNQWVNLYNRFFDVIEPMLGIIFPGSVHDGQEMYVWQFLAATGIGANPDQQQRLVVAVKDRVMETVVQSKTLPPDMASQRLADVNLFMRAIGLDVDLLG